MNNIDKKINTITQETNPCDFQSGVCRRGRLLIEKGKMPADKYYGCCGGEFAIIHAQLGISMPKDLNAPKCNYLGKNGCIINYMPCKLWFCDVAENYIKDNYKKYYAALVKLRKLYKRHMVNNT